MAKSNGIKDLKQAAKLLNKHAPDGEKLAYINKKEAELLREKIQTLDQITNYVGEYFSKEWVQNNVLLFSDDEINSMNKDIEAAQAAAQPDQGDLQ